jgi:hypothetical protein
VLAANTAGSDVPHAVVAMPSFSVGESLLSHYGHRLPALEQRFLVASLMIHRLRHARLVFVGSVAPDKAVMAYYRQLGPGARRFGSAVRLVDIGDSSPRAVAAKLLERPDLIADLRRAVAGRLAMLEPWNVTDAELAVAEALDVPINGTPPGLRRLGFKSEGRRLLRAAGVPVPFGVENVRTQEEVLSAIARIQTAVPGLRAVVVKHDDSGAGDGNAIVKVVDGDGRPLAGEALIEQVSSLPDWYLADLTRGAVVEEKIIGEEFRSPSAQLDLFPDGRVLVLATHEQHLGGATGQVYIGCRFPADAAYAGRLAEYAAAAGEQLAQRGVVGRVSVDFAAARRFGRSWSVYALEMNLRRGGTTHPYCVLRNLVPGRYDSERGQWVADANRGPRAYVCSDSEGHDTWRGLRPAEVLGAVRQAGLQFDYETGTGTVLHSLSGLEIDGRIGMTAVANDPETADAMALLARTAIHDLATSDVTVATGSSQEVSLRHDQPLPGPDKCQPFEWLWR